MVTLFLGCCEEHTEVVGAWHISAPRVSGGQGHVVALPHCPAEAAPAPPLPARGRLESAASADLGAQ